MMGVNTARKSSASSAECKGQRHKSCHPADLLEPGKSPASISFAVEQMHACAMQFILISVFAQVPCYSAVSLQVNVYWLTVDHDIKSHVSEVIRPLLKLASQEECEMMWR